MPIDAETAALLRYADRCHRVERRPVRPHVGRAAARCGISARRRRAVPEAAAIAAARALIGWQRRRMGRPRDAPAARRHGDRFRRHRQGIRRRSRRDDLPRARHRARARQPRRRRARDRRRSPTARRGASASAIRASRSARSPASMLVDAARGDERRLRALRRHRRRSLLPPARSGTGMPVAHWRAVSVVAPLAIVAGSLATIAMLLEARADVPAAQRRLVAVDATARSWLARAAASAERRARRRHGECAVT